MHKATFPVERVSTLKPEVPNDVKVEFCRDAAAWDSYVRQAPGASTYHQWAWRRVVEETFGHPAHYLAASANGPVRGVLPLIEMKSVLFGHFLISMPFFNYGGVLADSDAVAGALLESAGELARELGVRHIELRQGEKKPLPWSETTAKVAMVVPIKSPDEMMKKLGSRLRNKIRHAQKHGLEVRWGIADQVDPLYQVFAENMRNLGTPVMPKDWFVNVCRFLPENTRIMTVWDEDQPVAATLITDFRKFVELPWIASTAAARKHYSTYLLYWTALEWAHQHGYEAVDLGRCTPGAGTHQFKQQWNPTEVPLHWYYWLASGVPLPHLRPDNPKYKLAISTWQKMPLWFTNWLGPKIVRSIP
jgi:FemAB-related protein (PEP-CTERM system-associated)